MKITLNELKKIIKQCVLEHSLNSNKTINELDTDDALQRNYINQKYPDVSKFAKLCDAIQRRFNISQFDWKTLKPYYVDMNKRVANLTDYVQSERSDDTRVEDLKLVQDFKKEYPDFVV